MSTFSPALPTSSNTSAATPGVSGKSVNVTSACDESSRQSSIAKSSMPSSRRTTSRATRLLQRLACGRMGRIRPPTGRGRRALCTAFTAAGPSGRSTTAEILISLVAIDVNVDLLGGQGLEHPPGHALLAGHAATPTTDTFATL